MVRPEEKAGETVIVIKPVWWRQLAFTLLLGVLAVFFAALDFGWQFFNTGLVGVFGFFSLLNLLDQVCSWSRLRIDSNGYSLRTWFRKLEFRIDEVENFLFTEYMARDLILAKLTDSAATERGFPKAEIPFPCTFGRPVNEIFETLRNSLPEGSSMLE